MKIVITPSEAIERGIWDKLCDIRGINTWAVREGLMESDEKIYLVEVEAQALGLIPYNE